MKAENKALQNLNSRLIYQHRLSSIFLDEKLSKNGELSNNCLMMKSMMGGQLLNVKHYFYMQCLAFKVIGIDITSQMKTLRRPWLTLLTGANLLTLMISNAHFSWKHLDDLDKVTASLTPFLQGLLSICKVCIFIYNREDMLTLIKRIWMMTIKANAEELKILREENLHETLLSRYYGVAVIVTAAAVCIPLLIYIYTFFVNPASIEENIDKLTPFQTSYFMNPLPPLNYVILYMWSVSSITFLVCGSLAVDTLFCWYVYNVAGEFRMLCRQIQRVAAEDGEEESGHAPLELSVRSCIRKHQRVIGNCEELNRVFSWIIFVEFTINCLQICFLAYQLGRGVAAEDIPFLALFQLAVAVQLMIYCYGGQRIKDESQGVATEIYCSFKWEKVSVSIKKMLLVSILRAQKGCYLNGNFFTLDLSMYLLVFRNAASYVSLLRSINE